MRTCFVARALGLLLSETGTLQETLSGVCPGQRYETFVYHGQSNNITPRSNGGTTAEGILDGILYSTPTYPCSPASSCTVRGGSDSYGLLGLIPALAATLKPALSILFGSVVDPAFSRST